MCLIVEKITLELVKKKCKTQLNKTKSATIKKYINI